MYLRKIFIGAIIVMLIMTNSIGQKVTVSPEISIRNNVAYDIIGQIGDRILFYKEKGNDREVLLYDENLVFQSERQITLDEKRCTLYEVVNLDTAFAVIYGYRFEGNDITKMDLFASTAERIDSLTLTSKERKWRGLNFESLMSEDETKISLYSITDDNKITITIIDITNRKVLSDQDYSFNGTNLYDEVMDFQLGNDGTFYMLTEKNNFKNKKKGHIAQVFEFSGGEVNEIRIPLNDLVCQDLMFSLNNEEGLIGIAGLYDEKRNDESTGYFWIMGDRRSFDNKELRLVPFDEEIYFEVYGERNKSRMENFKVAEIIWKADATPILAFEMSYDVSRRNGGAGYTTQGSYNTFGRSGIGGGPAWSDHYRDDLILISLNKENEKIWHQVFYKKQFSQNDNAVYSSFFPFITPSRLRLIYNDEIKNNSTVSEYILDGDGNYKRTSVLSTEYQNLRLRFPDAVQISSTEILVPSQKSYAVNIVKIDFSR